MEDTRTAVLVHGLHLQCDLNGKDWEIMAFGGRHTQTLEGRAVMGIKVALDFGAELIIFSTGASEREGVKEGEYTFGFATMCSDRIADCIGHDVDDVNNLLQHDGELDLESQNTREECERNFALCAERGITRVILVSSPWHIQRCHTEALKVAEKMRGEGKTVPDIIAIASHGSTEGVVVLEPSHRGDQKVSRMAELGARTFRIQPGRRDEFERRFEQLLSEEGV